MPLLSETKSGSAWMVVTPVPCDARKLSNLKNHMLLTPFTAVPKYETLASLGSNCGVDDLKAICKGHELCNAYSLDTISVGAVIFLCHGML